VRIRYSQREMEPLNFYISENEDRSDSEEQQKCHVKPKPNLESFARFEICQAFPRSTTSISTGPGNAKSTGGESIKVWP
jgi:hypothetical protein